MKTPKQLSEEVLRKISARKEKQKRLYRQFQKIAAVILIAAIVVPVSLHFATTSDLNPNIPLSTTASSNEDIMEEGNVANDRDEIFTPETSFEENEWEESSDHKDPVAGETSDDKDVEADESAEESSSESKDF